MDETLLTERLIALLSAGFGLLATIGLYAVMAFVVARRTKELGLWMAQGTQRGSVVWLVIGIPTAIGLGRFVAAQLYGSRRTIRGWRAPPWRPSLRWRAGSIRFSRCGTSDRQASNSTPKFEGKGPSYIN